MDVEHSQASPVQPRKQTLGAIWWTWHAATLAALIVIPHQLLLGPVWQMSPRFVPFALGMCATYATGAIALALSMRRSGTTATGIARPLVCAIAPLAALFYYLLATEAPYPRSVLLPFAALFPLALLASVRLGGHGRVWSLAAVTIGVGVALMGGARVVALQRGRSPRLERRIVASSLYNLRLTAFHNYFEPNRGLGGAIAPLGPDYLVLLGDGQLFLLSVTPGDDQISVTDLHDPVPMDREAFLRDEAEAPGIDTRYFRAADVLAQDFGDRSRIFVSYLHWNREDGCATLDVSFADTTQESIRDLAGQPWTPLFETRPCLGLKDKGDVFAGWASGGRMALVDSTSLLLTTGDLEFDGVHEPRKLAQDDSSSWGKTVLIDLSNGTSRTYTKGHRSPEGLYVSSSGEIWETEHGPQGGDELNRIVEARNYGWPLVTYGTAYDSLSWPLNPMNGRHEGYEPPVFSWVPSVGVSAVLELERDRFEEWRGDLLVATLTGQEIWRLRRKEESIVLAEPIHIQDRIRDMIEGPSGELILLTEGPSFWGPREPGIVIVEPTNVRPSPAESGGPS